MTIGIAIFALLFGGIPFGRLLYTIFGDLPEKGGNIPALALWLRGYHKLAVATATLECLKIWFTYQVILSLGYTPEVAAQAAALALAGHCLSPWLKFSISMATAPFIGILLCCGLIAAALGVALWWQVWRKTEQAPAAFVATLSCIPLVSYVTGNNELTLYTLPLALLGCLWQSRYIRI